MIDNLNPKEEKQLHVMLNNQKRGIRSLNITANLLLVFGGLFWVGTVFYLLQNLTDNAAYFVGLPNFVCGMLLIAGYTLLSSKVTKLKQINSMLIKLSK